MTDGPRRGEVLRSAVWFLVTFLSVWVVGAGGELVQDVPDVRRAVTDGFVFAVSLLAILLAHEMGHYVVARMHGFALSPPLFIPMPIGFFGTMGAVIRLRSMPRSRQALLEMGAAGPLSGAVVAFVLMWVFLPDMRTIPPPEPGEVRVYLNDPLIAKLIGIARTGEAPALDAVWHPAAWAGWVGCLVTGLNLLPIGQLDGGHVLRGSAPRLAARVARMLPLVAVAGSWFYTGWLVWGFLLRLLGADRSLPVPDEPPLPLRSRFVALAVLALFVLTFIPVPIVGQGIRDWLGGGGGAG